MDGRRSRISVCGRLEVVLDGEAVEQRIRGRQGRLLLAYLVLHRDRAVRRDELVGALWPDGRAPAGDPLAPLLSRLRAALGPGRLEGRAELRLNVRTRPVRDLGDMGLATLAALEWAYEGGTADQCAALALEALAGGELHERDNGLMATIAAYVLELAERDEALAAWEREMAVGHARGSLLAANAVHLWYGWSLLRRGDLRDAEAFGRQALADSSRYNGESAPVSGFSLSNLAEVLLARGEPQAARGMIARAERWLGLRANSGRYVRRARLAVLLDRGRVDDAVRQAEQLLREDAWVTFPADTPWHGLAATAFLAAGRTGRARELSDREVALARRFGAPGAVARRCAWRARCAAARRASSSSRRPRRCSRRPRGGSSARGRRRASARRCSPPGGRRPPATCSPRGGRGVDLRSGRAPRAGAGGARRGGRRARPRARDRPGRPHHPRAPRRRAGLRERRRARDRPGGVPHAPRRRGPPGRRASQARLLGARGPRGRPRGLTVRAPTPPRRARPPAPWRGRPPAGARPSAHDGVAHVPGLVELDDAHARDVLARPGPAPERAALAHGHDLRAGHR